MAGEVPATLSHERLAMKTLSDLKKVIKVGVKLDLKHHSGWSPGVREVAKVNSVGFGLATGGDVSWCDWPKASQLVIKSDKSFAVKKLWFNKQSQQEELIELLTYTIVEEAAGSLKVAAPANAG